MTIPGGSSSCSSYVYVEPEAVPLTKKERRHEIERLVAEIVYANKNRETWFLKVRQARYDVVLRKNRTIVRPEKFDADAFNGELEDELSLNYTLANAEVLLFEADRRQQDAVRKLAALILP